MRDVQKMHSNYINISYCVMKDFKTNLSWSQWLVWKQVTNTLATDLLPFLEKLSPSCSDALLVPFVIHSSLPLANLHVWWLSHVWDVGFLDETPRAWTFAKELDTCKKNPNLCNAISIPENMMQIDDILFRVVSWITKETREEVPYDTVNALNQQTIMVCIDKIVVKEKLPYSLH